MDDDVLRARAFHGHLCPGLSLGVRVARIALRDIGTNSDAAEVLAIVETDLCPIDAIQALTGCTFGKGNLIHHDHGKSVFTFIRRSDGKALRIAARPDGWPPDHPDRQALFARVSTGAASPTERRRFAELQEQRSLALLEVPESQLFDIRSVSIEVPRRQRTLQALRCTACGETMSANHTRGTADRPLCIPCYTRAEM